jgi:soluble lytic murein transglycosylase
MPQSESNPSLQLTQELALERDFYGFLASEKLEQKYSFNHRPLQVDNATSARVRAMPALQRARELYFHEFIVEANREWHAATREFDRAEWMAAARLTHQWQWHSRAIIAMARAEYWDDIVIRFPLAYQHSLKRAAQSSGVASPTLFAIARQESAFERHATSSAGAIGLLQIMPATARATARKFVIPYRNKMQLRDIETNLPIGSQYYKSLLTNFNNNRILATAAYNAGPDRVGKWLARSRGKLPFDIWVELIPFKETRGYVTNVLMYSAIYSHRLGIDAPMLNASERARLL